MKKLFIGTVLLCASAIGLSAQNSKGGISEDMLKEISKGYTGSAEQKAVRNALAVNPISELSVNAENLSMCDTYFSHQVKTKGITNQLSSGRCWLFTGLNVLRAKMIDKYELPEMVFSHNYLSFHDLLEKSNLFLQAIIDTRKEAIDSRQVEWLLKSPIGDGGQFTGVSNLIMKYGVVPKSVMPETYQSNNTD
ncbi:MAG: aminopeptidase, partial [Muribaculaceae bacterium]|nr:aminopeptidase [Muribaculaceae bacterium]